MSTKGLVIRMTEGLYNNVYSKSSNTTKSTLTPDDVHIQLIFIKDKLCVTKSQLGTNSMPFGVHRSV